MKKYSSRLPQIQQRSMLLYTLLQLPYHVDRHQAVFGIWIGKKPIEMRYSRKKSQYICKKKSAVFGKDGKKLRKVCFLQQSHAIYCQSQRSPQVTNISLIFSWVSRVYLQTTSIHLASTQRCTFPCISHDPFFRCLLFSSTSMSICVLK